VRNWPEFAEYDCTACHHDLKRRSARQDYYNSLADRGIVPGKQKVGQLPWGTWYYPLMPVLQRHVIGAPKELQTNLAALDKLMRLKEPPRQEVRKKAGQLRDQLDGWIVTLVRAEAQANVAVPVVVNEGSGPPRVVIGGCAAQRTAPNLYVGPGSQQVRRVRQTPGVRSFTDAELRAILRDLANQTDPVRQGWDGGSQVYLGLAAMNQAMGDADPAFRAKMPYKVPLTDVRVGLKASFEPNARNPDHSRTLYDTPNDYPDRLDAILKGLKGFRPSK
jgi:hypothetical protein